MGRTHWCGEDVQTLETTLGELPGLMPRFERYAFGRNRFRDVIVRTSPDEAQPLPIGTVSKQYVLVQHADAVRAVIAKTTKAGIDPVTVPARLLISEYGTRIALRATLPEKYDFTPDDGHRMALTFECFNSVDGTVPLCAAVGWFRFVCSNGLIVGTTSASVRQRHSPRLEIDEISEVLADGMEFALQDTHAFGRWRSTKISEAELARWVDGPVADAWGPLAAARVFAISDTGWDGARARPFRNGPPHSWSLNRTDRVPGTTAPCRDGYEIAQVLAWVASQRGDVAQRLQWQAQIRALISHLVS
jgi:Domain of unknown function (DUF932)